MTEHTVARIVSARTANPAAIAESAATRARRAALTGVLDGEVASAVDRTVGLP